MKKLLLCLLLVSLCAFAQTVETIPFRAIMSSNNEVPPIAGLNASGMGTFWVHVVRNASGEIISGSVDFDVTYSFPGEVTFTGLHFHNGPAGVNAGVTVNTGLSGTATVTDPTGRGRIVRQAQVAANDANGLATLKGMLQDPSQYYANLHTTVNAGGAIRGQLQRADMAVLMGLMSTRNEVPPIQDTTGSAVGSVIALRTRDSSGVTSGLVIFDVNYTGFPDGTRFTGLHIHNGVAGVNAGVTVSSGVSGGANAVPAAQGGSGNLHYEAEVNLASAPALDTLNGLYGNPSGYYINVHSEVYPGGVARSQLHNTDRMLFPVTMLTSNEVPPIPLDASGLAQVTAYTLRDSTGNVTAGTVIFDVNFRFPDQATFTGLHIHDGAAGANGGVTINAGLSGSNTVASTTGSGNIYRIVNVSGGAALTTLNSMVSNPENHYINLHTTVNPGGVVRSQLMPLNTAKPVVGNVISAVSDGALKTVAPRGLMTIFGSNLAKVSTGLAGWVGATVPSSLNGTQVTVGGKNAPLLVVTPDYIVAQAPSDLASGNQALVVTNSNGDGTPSSVSIAAAAPALFFDGSGGIVQRNSDFSLIRPNNPAAAGEVLIVYGTGFGTTSPGLLAGLLGPDAALAQISNVTATLGGQNAPVVYAVASPGFAGLDQVAIRVPSGLPAGNAALVLKVGNASSNTVTIAVR